ncbi:DNA cytosine methyltransferase [Phytomonospora sp. NPDC050363]|uniref:DNA cytosine methyltransferase n=1 Tax=Phytomonospora sp. NPDC050363 TaxID=3155642 RepID=UPI0033C51C82
MAASLLLERPALAVPDTRLVVPGPAGVPLSGATLLRHGLGATQLTVTDFYCGAGGSTQGFTEAGWTVVLAANHSPIAIETHSANHGDTEHLLADIIGYDMTKLPTTDVLWASPICTEISLASRRKRAVDEMQMMLRLADGSNPFTEEEEFEGVDDPSVFAGTRATAFEVYRAVQVHQYKAIVVENVPQFVTDWPAFRRWRRSIENIGTGYNSVIISVSSAHVSGPGNDAAPQVRDRIYVVFVQRGIPMPDFSPRPLARCGHCGTDVEALQVFRPGRTVGKWGQQYDYACPNNPARHGVLIPYMRGADTIIDWHNLGTPIGSRKKTAKRPEGLAPATMERIRTCLAMYPPTGSIGSTHVDDLAAQLIGGELHRLPMVIEYRRNSTGSTVADPLATITAAGNHHGLLIPYRKALPRPTSQPLHTLATRDSAGLLIPAADVDIAEMLYRMLTPREQASGQRFPLSYVIHGTAKEQTMQAGNAVSVNVAHWIATLLAAVL